MTTKITFPLGITVMTRGVEKGVNPESVTAALRKHEAGDWGDVCDEDKDMNDQALVHGNRILSAYEDDEETKFWIITEADRSTTTVLLPQEY